MINLRYDSSNLERAAFPCGERGRWGMEKQVYSHEAAHAASQAGCAAHGALFELAAARWPACPPDVMVGQSGRRRAPMTFSDASLPGSCS